MGTTPGRKGRKNERKRLKHAEAQAPKLAEPNGKRRQPFTLPTTGCANPMSKLRIPR